MGGFQPFLRARRENYMTEGLGDVAGAHWQHTKRRLPWRALTKRSETAQSFLINFSPKSKSKFTVYFRTRPRDIDLGNFRGMTSGQAPRL